MSKLICRICLRTDVKVRDIHDTLVDFHEELSEYETYVNAGLKYCTYCEYILIKCYRFKQKCIQANKILRNHKQKSHGYPKDLHQMLPPIQSLGLSTVDTLTAFNLQDGILQPFCQFFSKKNSETSPLIKDITLSRTDSDTHDIVWLTKTVANDHGFYMKSNSQKHQNVDATEVQFVKQEDNLCSDSQSNLQAHNFLQNVGSTSDKKKTLPVMINFEVIKENTANNTHSIKTRGVQEIDVKNTEDFGIKLENESNYSNADIKFENESNDSKYDSSESSSDTEWIAELKKKLESYPYRKTEERKFKRGVLKNQNEIEKVFEILYFATDEEAKEELEQRKTSEPYLSAPHKCDICYTVYRSVKLLEFHRRWHDPSAGDLVCDICKMRFKVKRAVRNHITSTHYARFKCKLCPLITYHKSVMDTHFQKHDGVIYECKKCPKKFNHRSSYMSHLRLRHKTEHICVTCARSFVSEKGLVAHRSLMHQTKSKTDSTASARCEPCGLTFVNEQVYIIHLKNTDLHKDVASSIIACNICGIKFALKEDVREHKWSQHSLYNNRSKKAVKKMQLPIASGTNDVPGKECKCTICGYLGSSPMLLRRHIAAEHPDSPYMADLARRRQHMCDTCGKCYTSQYILRDHINTHTGSKPYACESCPARFSSRLHLRLHAERHAPARHACARCGKKFFSASNLNNHMRTHIQDRRYKCSLCHKGFLHAGTLREHVRGVHNQERRVRKPLKHQQTSAHKPSSDNSD